MSEADRNKICERLKAFFAAGEKRRGAVSVNRITLAGYPYLMKALLIVAHGSRRKQSNDEVVALAERMRAVYSARYDIIHAAFLELSDPLIPDGIKKCVEDGASSVVVLPYFLNSGRHVVNDIPEIVSDSMGAFPGVDIRIAPHIGGSDLMMTLVVESAGRVSSAPDSRSGKF